MITDYTKIQVCNQLGSQLKYFAVGPGSQTLVSTMTTMTGSEFSRFGLTGSADMSTPKTIVISADLNSVQASGLVLRQFGTFDDGTINTGSAYTINQLNGSLVCDGTIELSFEQAVNVV